MGEQLCLVAGLCWEELFRVPLVGPGCLTDELAVLPIS